MINPWDIADDINYDKLVKKFGITPISTLPDEVSDDFLFRRKIIFAHRDLPAIFTAIKEKKPFVLMTGMMPTGKMHIGHMLVALQMIFWQKMGAKLYIAVADIEAYNARNQSLADSRKIAEDYIKNYIALGLKQKNVEVYFQSVRSKDGEVASKYYGLQNVLARHITFNEFSAVYGEISPGKMLSVLLQASDMLHANLLDKPIPVIVPIGIDQDPHIRLTRDVMKRCKEFKFGTLCSTYNIFMPGLKGGKMSSSDPSSFIALSDTPEEAKRKVNKYAFSGGRATLEEHRKKGGNPDVDISFQYLKLFFEPDDKKLAKIEKDYKSGKLLSGEMKQLLLDKLMPFLADLEKKRQKADISQFLKK